MTDDLTPEAFAAWAAAVGLNASTEHLELLRPEVRAMLAGIASLSSIDVSAVPIERAFEDGA